MATLPIETQAHFDALKVAQRKCNDLIQEIEKAEACGIDCTDYRQARDFLAGKIDSFLNSYFPSGSPSPRATPTDN